MMTFKTTDGSMRIRNFGFLQIVTYDGGGWFRLFGKGLTWKDLTQHPLLFSERNGFITSIKIGKYSFKGMWSQL